jgi:hypothetical protein
MPKYRQLHTKIVDSYDFNDMPDDFTRVFWLLLTVTSDSEGRSIDNPSWLRSKMFPMREDVKAAQINNAVEWLAKRGMIVRYQVSGHNYFYIPTFKSYQSGSEKEGKSVLPEPPDELPTYSEPTPEELPTYSASIQYNADTDTKTNTKAAGANAPVIVFPDNLSCDTFKAAWAEWETFRTETKHKLTPTTRKKQLAILAPYPLETAIAVIDKSITNGWQGLFPPENNGHKVDPVLVDVGGSF